MAAYPIKLDDDEYGYLRKLCDAGPTVIRSLAESLENNGDFVKPSKFRQKLEANLSDKTFASETNRLLIALERRQRRYLLTVDQFLEGVELGLRRKEGWDTESLDRWKRSRSELARLLATKSVVLTSKAVDLSYDFERVHSTSRILTDIRPIYDEERREIIGTTITHTLRIQSWESFRVADFSCVISAEDIAHLKETCESALRKADLARRLIEDNCKIDVVLAQGDGNDDV